MSKTKANIIDTTDIKKLEEKLEDFDNQTRNKILYASLTKGAKVLYDATKQSLTAKMGYAATNPINKRGGGYYPPLIEGIRISGDRPYCEVKVHILGQGYLKWFETGTQPRETSKGYNRGSIQGLNFFFAAKQSSFAKVESTVTSNIDKQVKKYLK